MPRLPIPSSRFPALLLTVLALFLGGLVVAERVAAADTIPGLTEFQINSFAANCLQLVEVGRYWELANLFHLDPAAPEAEHTAERVQLAKVLGLLAGAFGLPHEEHLVEGPVAVK